MNVPIDFGLSAAETLAHVAGGPPPAGFARHWRSWWARHDMARARFIQGDDAEAARDPASCGAAGVREVIASPDGVRLGAALSFPFAGEADGPASAPPDLVAVTLHGYAVDPPGPPAQARVKPLIEPPAGADPHRLALLNIHVRGYPGSQTDTGPLCQDRSGYAGLAVDDPDRWAVNGAVLDVVAALCAAHARFPDAQLALWGESFGGGLAAIAAGACAMAAGDALPPIDRLVLGLPTLGAWHWRLSHEAPAGLGSDVARAIEATAEKRDEIVRTLLLHDSAYHARRVACPTLAKLAQRDEVVPAPAAAAVFNALSAGPGAKWRFVTRFGHYAGGDAGAIADLRRHVLFDRLALSFLDPARQPHEAMALSGVEF